MAELSHTEYNPLDLQEFPWCESLNCFVSKMDLGLHKHVEDHVILAAFIQGALWARRVFIASTFEDVVEDSEG